MKRQHKHAEMIRQWLDDASLKVETYNADSDKWYQIPEPSWYENAKYRFKTKMIKCGDLEFLEFMRVAPEVGTDYWLAMTIEGVFKYRWKNDSFDQKALSRSICHLTEEAAQAHGRALIALTEVKP